MIEKESVASRGVCSIADVCVIVLVAFLIWVAKAFVIPRPSCCVM